WHDSCSKCLNLSFFAESSMHRNLLSAVALVAGPLLWASGAQAAQITFANSAQDITFTGNGAGALSISSPVLSGSVFYDADPLGTTATVRCPLQQAYTPQPVILPRTPTLGPSHLPEGMGIRSPRPLHGHCSKMH